MSFPRNPSKIRNVLITVFVIVWSLVFHYESTRHFILEPLVKRSLPKLKFLFPPAGWIMFFQVSEGFGHVDVYGIDKESSVLIDPHDIFRTRTIGFDNIHRGILGVVTNQYYKKSFCGYLARRFERFDKFAVVLNYYPKPTEEPYLRHQRLEYRCVPEEEKP